MMRFQICKGGFDYYVSCAKHWKRRRRHCFWLCWRYFKHIVQNIHSNDILRPFRLNTFLIGCRGLIFLFWNLIAKLCKWTNPWFLKKCIKLKLLGIDFGWNISNYLLGILLENQNYLIRYFLQFNSHNNKNLHNFHRLQLDKSIFKEIQLVNQKLENTALKFHLKIQKT